MQAVEKLQESMLANGITSVHSMEGLNEFKLLQKMERQKRLKMRVRLYVPESEADALVSAGIYSGFGSDLLKIAGVKFFTDGALGSQTAYMLEPYEKSKQTGVVHMSAEILKQRIAFFNTHGLSTAVHAIGDAAVVMALDAFEYARQQQSKGKILNRMEHAQLVPVNQVKRFAELNVLASVQPVHIADDVYTAQTHWGKRCARAYPLRDFQEAGVPMAFGSDTPVAGFNPFKGMYSALERKYNCDPDENSWHPEQTLSLFQSLKAYTSGPARAVGEEEVAGTLKVGKRADFVVLNRNIMDLPAEVLLQTKVEMAVQSGRVAFKGKKNKG
jgi:predicted amidohydrolase YtcJ